MNRDRMLEELREVIDDSLTPYFWSDPALLGYLAEGEDLFCEETGYFREMGGTYTITLATGVATYAIPDRVIQVLDIWNGRRKLGKYQESDVVVEAPSGMVPFELADCPGAPTAWQADESMGYIVFDKTPTADEDGDVYTLYVWRYAAVDLAEDAAEPTLPTRFQRACIEWAASKALAHHDGEQQDPVKAKDHANSFYQYVSSGKKAMRRILGLSVRMGSNPVYRT